MIYITGDTHADFSRFEEEKFPIQSDMTKNDYVIICGDFGGVWNYIVEIIYEKHWLDWLNNKNFTTLFVDGNHENFERLYRYPVEKWHGGKVHKIRDSVIHLMRGEIYEYRKRGAYFRIRDYSWWDLGLPTEEEMQNGIKNLEKVNYKVNYIISHCCPTSIQTLLNPSYKKDILTDYLQEILEKCEFEKWYFGHYHDYRQINSQFTLLYENIVPLEFNSIFE